MISKKKSLRTLTDLSSVDKYVVVEDRSVEHLLDLDEVIIEVGGGYWVEISAVLVASTEVRPHGIKYALRLLDPSGKRFVCYDNAHPVSLGRQPSHKKSATSDHKHLGKAVKPYAYSDAATLLEDFWADVEKALKARGIS